jgi:FK506-binding nuclear protein
VIPISPDDEERYRPEALEDEYDLSPDEDELDLLEEGDDESDDLDDLEDPRVTEVDSDDDMKEAPKLVKVAKGKNKRPAEDSESEDGATTLDDLIAKSVKPEQPVVNGEGKLSKKERKKLKKLNNGQAAAVPQPKEEKKDTTPSPVKTDKKVQFADKLEQGPTKANKDKADAKKADKPKPAEQPKGKPGVKVVSGVTIDDRKVGDGPGAKKGDRLELRYIGKLDQSQGGKIFDCMTIPRFDIICN